MSNELQLSAQDTLLVISFRLGGAVFGIDAQMVQEVVKFGDITQVRHAPPHVVGIRNLRGRIVTVIDLCARLDLGAVSSSPDNRILIVEWQGEPVGLLVDSVSDTVSTTPGEVAPAPPNLHGVQGRNLRGVIRGGGRLIALINLDGLLQPDDRSISERK